MEREVMQVVCIEEFAYQRILELSSSGALYGTT
jgi:hypothetical protein